MGDTLRGHFNPLFKLVYSLISLGLFSIVGVLIFHAFSEIVKMFSGLHVGDDIYL